MVYIVVKRYVETVRFWKAIYSLHILGKLVSFVRYYSLYENIVPGLFEIIVYGCIISNNNAI